MTRKATIDSLPPLVVQSKSVADPMALEKAVGGYNRDFQHLITPSSTFHDGPSTPASISPTSVYLDDQYPLNVWRGAAKPHPRWYHRPPLFILVMSFIEIAVFSWRFGDTYQTLVFNRHYRGEVWRYVSYMLLHQDCRHLLMNVSIQVTVTWSLELHQARHNVGVVYVAGVVWGALAGYILQPESSIIGASAGIYALLISHVADIAFNRGRKYFKCQALAVFFLTAGDIVYSLCHIYLDGNTSPKIGWSTHCAGASAGFLLGFVLYHGKHRSEVCMRAATYTSAILWLAIFITAIVLNFLSIHI